MFVQNILEIFKLKVKELQHLKFKFDVILFL